MISFSVILRDGAFKIVFTRIDIYTAKAERYGRRNEWLKTNDRLYNIYVLYFYQLEVTLNYKAYELQLLSIKN